MSARTLQPPKGTSDILFEDTRVRVAVGRRMLGVLERYGFNEIQTPGIEHIEVLEAMAGEEITGQLYDFVDKGGRRLGLKSDITAAVARVVAAQSVKWPQPIKIAVHDRVYRYERPQKGRMREFWHLNAEMFGAKDVLAEAEIVACFVDCYRCVGLRDITVRLSERYLLFNLLEHWGVPSDQLNAVVRALDKRLKVSRPVWVEELGKAGFPKGKLDQLDEVINAGGNVSDIAPARAVLGGVPSLAPVLDRLEQLAEHLDQFGVADCCAFDFSIARGLEYYTGLIFECYHAPIEGKTSYGAIGGGGRYDNLVEKHGGPSLDAIGFAVGFERVMLILQDLGLYDAFGERRPGLYVAYNDAACQPTACRVARDLRQGGHRVEMVFEPANFKKLLRKATARDVAYVVVIGTEELESETVRLKNLATREEQVVAMADLVRHVNGLTLRSR